MNKNRQYGAVSLFVVVFAALLITVVTVSFVRIMVSDQQQASTTDLSQSAYDSAQAGVEDAKRALLRLQSACSTSGDPAVCSTATADVNSLTCNDAVKTLDDVQAAAAKSKNGEINVQVGSTNNDLDQAYTCVKISMQTADYVGELVKDSSKLIPLVGVSNFDTVKIEWFSPSNLAAPAVKAVIPTVASGVLLSSTWDSNQPPIMRAGLTQFANTGFTLTEFDSNTVNASNNTLFLYPSNAVIPDTTSFTSDSRKTPTGKPVRATCKDLSAGDEYACSAILSLPVASGVDHTQYLNLASLYNKTSYRVSLLNGALPVKFNGVQPSVDSTGRANDLFRRVETRVEMTDINFPYPNAAVDTTGNLCKDFTITDDTKDYVNRCTP